MTENKDKQNDKKADNEKERGKNEADPSDRVTSKDEFGTQRVYKKTSPNCVLTLYLPTREITLASGCPSVLRGIVFVDPKAIQGYRIYAQMTLTFRYGREDEEVMGLRFCNEAIMSLHQVWPRSEEPASDSLSPLQEALVKRLGDGAHPFTLTLSPQAPPSVQLVPAKRYFGAPIGTSYDVRCFIADKTDEKFHRRASVKMGIRVIYRTDVFRQNANGPENFAALINNQPVASPPSMTTTTTALASPPPIIMDASSAPVSNNSETQSGEAISPGDTRLAQIKSRKSDRGDSFPKLRLSPKSFRFSGRFGRSKSEIEKCPSDPFYNYSKSFQEYDNIAGGGPQGVVDKPFLLQDGRVCLRASLNKAWYTHGEEICVTINIRNDSRKTVRKVRVCAIQHVDVCMFNNGKFKNVVADSESQLPPVDRTVAPGGSLNATVSLKPQRGPTKNWIALEDTLQRSTEPDEITGAIAASAIRSPNLSVSAGGQSISPGINAPQTTYHCFGQSGNGSGGAYAQGGNVADDRNVFAIYVSYYVKVKLTLSGMGGELSLKLPFILVHVDDLNRMPGEVSEEMGAGTSMPLEKLALEAVPANKKNGQKTASDSKEVTTSKVPHGLDRIESMSLDDELNIRVPVIAEGNATNKRRLLRSETLAKYLDEDSKDTTMQTLNSGPLESQGGNSMKIVKEDSSSGIEMDLDYVHVVQIHSVTRVPEDEREKEKEKEDEKEEEESVDKYDEIEAKNVLENTENTENPAPEKSDV